MAWGFSRAGAPPDSSTPIGATADAEAAQSGPNQDARAADGGDVLFIDAPLESSEQASPEEAARAQADDDEVRITGCKCCASVAVTLAHISKRRTVRLNSRHQHASHPASSFFPLDQPFQLPPPWVRYTLTGLNIVTACAAMCAARASRGLKLRLA
jgi:hypothetical protein